MKIRFFSLAIVLAAVLTACPSSPPVVSSITVTAPSGNALKINEAVQFSAVAKDDSNTLMTGKTFTWLSSDPNIASVDIDGKVTAKRFGTVKITASTDGVNGDSSSQKTFGLEAIGGTSCNDCPQAHTAFLARFRKADGSMPNANGTFKVTGPVGWNVDKPLEYTYNGSTGFVFSRWWDGILAKNGTYTFETSVGGETFSSSFEIDATDRITAPTSLILSNVSPSSVSGSWSVVTGANAYMFEVWNDTESKNAFNQWLVTNNTTGTVSGQALDISKTYFARVHAFTVSNAGGTNSIAFTGTLPKQFNVGFFQPNTKITF
jgi:Bacterial Ig-like domain (group 2)